MIKQKIYTQNRVSFWRKERQNNFRFFQLYFYQSIQLIISYCTIPLKSALGFHSVLSLFWGWWMMACERGLVLLQLYPTLYWTHLFHFQNFILSITILFEILRKDAKFFMIGVSFSFICHLVVFQGKFQNMALWPTKASRVSNGNRFMISRLCLRKFNSTLIYLLCSSLLLDWIGCVSISQALQLG